MKITNNTPTLVGDLLREVPFGAIGRVIEVRQDGFKVEIIKAPEGYNTPLADLETRFEPLPLDSRILADNGFQLNRKYAKSLFVWKQKKPERKVTWNPDTHELVISRDASTYDKSCRHKLVDCYCDDLPHLQHLLREFEIEFEFKKL